MKRLRKWEPGINSPWLTRAEAADYLRWSVQTVDRYLTPAHKGKEPGKIRFEVLDVGKVKQIRLLAEDVYQMLPTPQNKLEIV